MTKITPAQLDAVTAISQMAHTHGLIEHLVITANNDLPIGFEITIEKINELVDIFTKEAELLSTKYVNK